MIRERWKPIWTMNRFCGVLFTIFLFRSIEVFGADEQVLVPRALEKLAQEFNLPILSEDSYPPRISGGGFFSFHRSENDGVLIPFRDSSFQFRLHGYKFDARVQPNESLGIDVYLSLKRRIDQIRSAIPFQGPRLLGLTIVPKSTGEQLPGLRVEKVEGRSASDLQKHLHGVGNISDAWTYIHFIRGAVEKGLIPLDAYSSNFYLNHRGLVPFDISFVSPEDLRQSESRTQFLIRHEEIEFQNTLGTLNRAAYIIRLQTTDSSQLELCHTVIEKLQGLYQQQSRE